MTVWRNARLVTLTGDHGWGLIDDGVLVTEGDTIRFAGTASELQQRGISETHDLRGAVVTPGLIDCHTHLVYAGQRAHEFEARLQGESYESIARAGGGIRATVAATRAASADQLYELARDRLTALQEEGVTTVEIKSGYGLSERDEAKCLRVARRLDRELPATVRTTYLAAHAVPLEFEQRADDYIDAVCNWMTTLHAEHLIDAVDAFCEKIGFTLQQTERVFDKARSLNLPIKLHAEQLSDMGGAALAARYRALSCDHLEYLGSDGVRALASAGTVAVLLPGAYYFLRETQLPPMEALHDAGVPIAIATDHNPGTSPTLSPLLMLNMACTLFRLTPEQALRGMTVNGARALGLSDRGRLAAGQRADFAVWDIDHPNELAYFFGRNPCRQVVVAGSAIR